MLQNPLFWLAIIAGIVWCGLQLINRMRTSNRFDTAYNSAAVGAAVGFWVKALLLEHPELDDGNRENKQRFEYGLRRRLAAAYAASEYFPDIGVFYYAPYHYGLCPILWESLFAAGLGHPSNRDIAHNHFRRDGRMKIALSSVSIEPTFSTAALQKVIWDASMTAQPADEAECLA